MNSDVKAVRIATTGAAVASRSRIRQIFVTATAGTPRLTITDGSGGATVLDLDFTASTSGPVDIPDDGILCANGIYVSVATNLTAATIFYS